jgi:hypothetical protein
MAKKCQSAVEFLLSYGWAFIAVLVMIGALAYFGIFDSERFLPPICNFGPSVSCNGREVLLRAHKDDTLVAKLRNNFGSDVMVFDGSINWILGDPSITGAALGGPAGPSSKKTNLCFKNDTGSICHHPEDWEMFGYGFDDCMGGPCDSVLLWNGGKGYSLKGVNATLWPDAETRIFAIGADNAEKLNSGTRIAIKISFKYYDSGSSPQYAKEIVGEIITRVE